GDSGLFDPEFENLLPDIRNYCESTGFPAWHAPSRSGFFRYLVVRKSFSADECLVNLVTHDDDRFDIHVFSDFLREKLGKRLAGLLHTINTDTGERSVPLAGSSRLIYGKDHVVETMAGLSFRISMTSFFQTNPRCAELLYRKTIDYVKEPGFKSDGVVLDLFCGTGTIAQLLAGGGVPEVAGVDIVESAIDDARANVALNNLDRVKFVAADVGNFLRDHPEYRGNISCVVLDPPRGGIAPKTLQKTIMLEAPRIVYVSCNPATQARDALALREAGYQLRKLSLVDQFPHTAHIEAIGWWELA
ncbi:MAG: 23S rRNA (uracil(1939)-C(5))-methyltransferase RlmD, partial [Flavobacteriales bacterium]|nr:23S rRNA (uracil(1939)-C(5))-methyltransferase RlmD [Flavobacteriales bacterium]